MMTISRIVLTMSKNQVTAGSALSAVRDKAALAVGKPQQLHVPVVMEEAGERQSIGLFRWLEDLPGVESAEIVLAFFDEPSVPAWGLSQATSAARSRSQNGSTHIFQDISDDCNLGLGSNKPGGGRNSY